MNFKKNLKLKIIVILAVIYALIVIGYFIKRAFFTESVPEIKTDINYLNDEKASKFQPPPPEKEDFILKTINQIKGLEDSVNKKKLADKLGVILSSYPATVHKEEIKRLISKYIKASSSSLKKLTLSRYYSEYPYIYDYYKFFDWRVPHYEITARVLGVFDGDTVRTDKGVIRFMGIDTTEMNTWKDVPPERGAVLATNFVKNAVDGRQIKVIIVRRNEKDHYDRFVGLILYGENFSKCLNIELMLEGYAEPKYYRYTSFIRPALWAPFRRYFKY